MQASYKMCLGSVRLTQSLGFAPLTKRVDNARYIRMHNSIWFHAIPHTVDASNPYHLESPLSSCRHLYAVMSNRCFASEMIRPKQYVLQFPVFENIEECLGFYASKAKTIDAVGILGLLSRIYHFKNDARRNGTTISVSFETDSRFQQLIDAARAVVPLMDNRSLSAAVMVTTSLNVKHEGIHNLCLSIAELIVLKHDTFHPKQLGLFALGFSSIGIKSPNLIEFLKAESLKYLNEFNPQDLYAILESMRRWGVFDKAFADAVIERTFDSLDQFSLSDVVRFLRLMADTALVRATLIRRLTTLVMDNLNQFKGSEASSVFESLSKLRSLSWQQSYVLWSHALRNSETLNKEHLVKLLIGACLCRCQNVDMEVESVIRKLPYEKLDTMSTFMITRSIYSICFFQFYDLKDFIKKGLTKIFSFPPYNNGQVLYQLHEILMDINKELPDCVVSVPEKWKAAIEEHERLDMVKIERSRPLQELVFAFDALQNEFKTQFQTGETAGGYRVDLYDPARKLCFEIDWIHRWASKRMRHRHLMSLGYRVYTVPFWGWRRLRSEEEQLNYIRTKYSSAFIETHQHF